MAEPQDSVVESSSGPSRTEYEDEKNLTQQNKDSPKNWNRKQANEKNFGKRDGFKNKKGPGNKNPPFQRENSGFQGKPERRRDYKHFDRASEISRCSTLELPPLDMSEKKFNNRNRLFIGNIPFSITEEDLKKMFTPFGEIHDVFINKEKKSPFAFVTYDYHANAVKAMRELDGSMYNNVTLKVKFTSRLHAITVANLAPTVTNELLYHGFSIFGDIERAIVNTDDRGKSLGHGIVEFCTRKGQMVALEECTTGCYFLTASLRPVIVEPYEVPVDNDGYSEKSIVWKNAEFVKDREVGPWFAKPNSSEFAFATKWKEMRELYKQKEIALKRELEMEEHKLSGQMDFQQYLQETEMLKKLVEEREMFVKRQQAEMEQREQYLLDQQKRTEEEIRRKEELHYQTRNYLGDSRNDWNNRDQFQQQGYWRNSNEYENDPINTEYNNRNFSQNSPGNFQQSFHQKEAPQFKIENTQAAKNKDMNAELFKRRWESTTEGINGGEPFVSTDMAEGVSEELDNDYVRSPKSWSRSWDDEIPQKRSRF